MILWHTHGDFAVPDYQKVTCENDPIYMWILVSKTKLPSPSRHGVVQKAPVFPMIIIFIRGTAKSLGQHLQFLRQKHGKTSKKHHVQCSLFFQRSFDAGLRDILLKPPDLRTEVEIEEARLLETSGNCFWKEQRCQKGNQARSGKNSCAKCSTWCLFRMRQLKITDGSWDSGSVGFWELIDLDCPMVPWFNGPTTFTHWRSLLRLRGCKIRPSSGIIWIMVRWKGTATKQLKINWSNVCLRYRIRRHRQHLFGCQRSPRQKRLPSGYLT